MEGEPEARQARPQTSKPRGRDPSAARPMVLLPIMVFVAGATFLLMKEQAGKNGHAPLTRYIPIIVVALLLFIRLLPVLFDKSFGTIGLVQIFSPEFEQRIRARYQSETEQLSSIGFDLLFFVGDSTSMFRLALIFPAIVVLHMKRNRVPMTIQNGTTLLTGNPVFISRDKTAYAHPNSLGFTFHTRFQDGTILVSKNFGEGTGYIPSITCNVCPADSASQTWTSHQERIKEMETKGKRVDHQSSFEAYREIVLQEQTHR